MHMGTDTMRECAEQIEALATLLQESMEHGGNLDSHTYACVAEVMVDRAADMLALMHEAKKTGRTA